MKHLGKLAMIGAIGALTLVPAAAAQAATLDVAFDATGTSHIATVNSDVWIKPTTLSIGLESDDGSFTGHLPLQDADTKFHVAGFLPVKATVSFIEAAPLSGQLSANGSSIGIQSTASYYIKLSDVLIGGLPAFAGNYCQTKAPVSIPANTPPGESFNLSTGGTLVGEYAIGAFKNCGLNTPLINLLVPGGANTINIVLSNGRLG